MRCALMVWSLNVVFVSSEVVAQQHAPTVETPRQVLGLGPVRGGDGSGGRSSKMLTYMSKLRGSQKIQISNGGLHQA